MYINNMKIYKSLIINYIFFINYANSIPFETCFLNAAKKYNIPVELLIAIASIESNYNPDVINYNSNGTYDIGIMQINSNWFNKLQQRYKISQTELKNPCQNIMVGAWILSQNINKYGFTWTAIQKYNGYNINLKYSKKTYNKLIKIYPNLKSYNKTFQINSSASKFLFIE